MFKKATVGCLFAVAALALAACGSSSSSSSSSSGSSSSSSSAGGSGGGGANTVDFYSSLPLQGASSPQTTAMVNGAKLALEQAGGKAGTFTVNYQPLDDSTAQTGKWDPGQVAANARKAISDPKAVYYFGEFNSGASAISIPILNQAALPQVSPANTAVGLTSSDPGAKPGEPAKYYPTGKRNYLRIVPRDTIQASALLKTMKSDGCTKVAVADDKEVYGAGLASNLDLDKAKYGVSVVSVTGIEPTAPNFRSYAATIKAAGADCFVFSGITANGAAQIMKDVGAAIPNAKLYGPDGICESGFTNPAKHGIPAALGARFKCTVATLNLASYPGGKAFLKAYTAKYGDAHPDPYAIYGYEAMQLGLDTVKGLGPKGSDKAAVLAALFATKNRSSVLGTYSFNKNGDTSATVYGLYKVGADNNPTFVKAIK